MPTDKNSTPKIAVVMPRGMHFGPKSATSIDLCARDFVTYSAYSQKSTVFCEYVEKPFEGISLVMHRKKRELFQNIEAFKPDLVIVHQHQPTASKISQRLKNIPVLLHKHNFIAPKKGILRRFKYISQYRALAGIIFVSNACKNAFEKDWPEVSIPLHVVHNGLDFSEWTPNGDREKTIFFAGRLSPDKGVLDLAKAACTVLPQFPDWNIRLVCSEASEFPDYKKDVLQQLEPIASQVDFLSNQPFSIVKSHFEHASIAVVPSRFEEPFGRTAIEAFAGGGALITSGTGGLTEVVGNAAITLPGMTVESLSHAIETLIQSPEARQKLSQAGRARGESTFAIDRIAENLDKIYKTHIGQQKS